MFKQLRNQGEPVNASSREHHRQRRLRERAEAARAIAEVVKRLDPELVEEEGMESLTASCLKELNQVSIEKDDIRIRMRKVLRRRLDDSDLVRSFIDKIDWVNAKENELLNLVIKLEQNPHFLRSSSISKSELLEEWLVFSEPCRDILQKKIKANIEATRLAEEKTRLAEEKARLIEEENARLRKQFEELQGGQTKQKSSGVEGFFSHPKEPKEPPTKRTRRETGKRH